MTDFAKVEEIARLILSVSAVSYDEATNERRAMARAAAEKVLAALPPSPAVVPPDLRTLVPGFRLDWSGLRNRFEDAVLRLEKLITYESRAAHLDEMAREFEDAVTRALSASPSPPALDGAGRDAVIEECARVIDTE